MRLLEAILCATAAVSPPQGTAPGTATPPSAQAPAAPTAQVPAAPTAQAPAAPSEAQRIAQASSVGQLLYVFDRAAWVSSDALTAAVPRDKLTGAGGYVVEPADAKTLRATYYRGAGADARAFFVAEVRDGKTISSQLLPLPVALTPAQAVLVRAREIAAAAAMEAGYKPCTPGPFNTVVLPSREGGPVAVYLLSAQQDLRSYPMGGNYRVVVGADGAVLAKRPYSVSCLTLQDPKLPAGATPVGMLVSHLLDPVPTELHVFASYVLRTPLFVRTPDGHLWQVTGSRIVPADLKK